MANYSKRSVARFLAVQLLYMRQVDDKLKAANLAANGNVQTSYQEELQDSSLDSLVGLYNEQILHGECGLDTEARLVKPDKEFLESLLQYVNDKKEHLDALIAEHLDKTRDIKLLDPLIRALLEVGVAELSFGSDTPVKVIIDEYVNLAGSFFEGNEVGFTNSILDNISKRL
jgi:N utilization substance protein B